MGRITKVETQKKNTERVSVFLDDEFFCGLDAVAALKHAIKVGAEVDEDRLRDAIYDSEVSSAFEKCMRQIDMRPRTRQELEKYLIGKEYGEGVIDAAIQKLQSYNYIDDLEFAKIYIESYKKRWGRLKIEYMLKNKGIEPDILQEAFLEFKCQTNEAHKLLIKHTGFKEFNKQKAYAHLIQKGFDTDTIKQAISLIEEEQ